ncbi:Phosphatidylinositol 5-phosphate 4-kinase type-2 alpha, partial [Mortierella alpina]
MEAVRAVQNDSARHIPEQSESSLPTSSSLLNSMMPPAAALPEQPEPTMQKGRQRSSSIRSLMPIIVRGFSSSSERPEPEVTADNNASASKAATGPEEFTEIDLGPPITSTLPKEHTLSNKESDLNAPEPPPKDRDLRMLQPGIPNHGRDKQLSESHSQDTIFQQDESGLLSRPSRLWSKVRRVVQGDSRQGGAGQSRNSIYLSATGVYAGAVRSVSDTHLPTASSARGLSSSSRDSSLNIGMPSFGSSALSLLSEDQMSSQNGPSIQANNISPSALRISVVAFETPPETAANSPTPISPTKANGKSTYQHNLPGLARRSSTKSSAVAAEVTTAEYRVSQFTYSWQQARPNSGSHSRAQSNTTENADEALIDSLSIQDGHFATNLSSAERSSIKRSLLQPSRVVEDSDIGKSAEKGTESKQLTRSKSTSDAQKRNAYHQRRHDVEQSVSGQQQQPIRLTDYASPAKQRISLDQQQERCPPSPTVARNGSSSARPSTTTTTSSSALSPSQLLNSDTPHSPTKQDRRRSAISFGGYFAGPSSEAVRKARDQREHSVTGLETDDAKGEIIHMRRTAFFEKSTSPPLPSTSMLSSMLQSSLPTALPGAHTNSAGSSSALSRSPSKAYELAQYHQRRISTELTRPLSAITAQSVTGVGTGTGLGAAAAAEAAAAGVGTGAAAHSDAKKELRKKITPLKITPLLLSGVASLPSPMFGPLSATIPRPLGSSSTGPALDRYFFGVDQVHEWNIPSYGRVKFIDHAPMVFHAIRERFHYTLADMDEALSQPMTVMKTPGKSDAIFFASHNHGRFLLKTLRGAEPENLKGFLSDYLAHIHKYPNTLLPRYLGMYTFEKMSGSKALNGLAAESGAGAGGGGVGGGVGVGPGGVSGMDRDYGPRSRMTSTATGLNAKNDATATTAQHLHLNGTLLSGKDDGLPSKVVVVVLANVFDTPELVHERYDFKGSNVGRKTLDTTTTKSAPRRENYTGSSLGQDQARAMEPGRAMSLDVDPKGPNEPTGRGLHSNRPWSTQFGSKREENGLGGSTPGMSGVSEEAMDDISHLTLKEMDFQNRVHAGETQLIHLGPSRRSEVLSQLEDDTALLRKHGFMDYSMMVGIRIVPKQQEQEVHSDSSSHRSRRSRGSDADNSNLDSDEEDILSTNGSVGSSLKGARKADVGEALDKLWTYMHLSEFLTDERIAFLKKLGEKAQATIREVYSLGGSIVTNDHTRTEKSVKDRRSKTGPGAVELKPVHSTRQKKDRNGSIASKASRMSKHGKNKAVFDEWFDPESFQTVRYKPRGDNATRRPALHSLLDTPTMAPSGAGEQKKQKRTSIGVADPQLPAASTSHYKRPPLQQDKQQSLPKEQHQPIWSHGVTSEGLPEGYEVVYYFGLIDVLQKYNLVKWLERNLKGANVRLLGGGGSSNSAPSPSPLVHQPRPGTGSASFAASTLYQLLPQATASEPSLPTAGLEAMNPTLSVLLEDPVVSATSESKADASRTHDRLATSVSSSSGGGGDGQSAATRGPQPVSASYASSIFPSPYSSARTSQEEGTLYPGGAGVGAGTVPPPSSSLEDTDANANIIISSHTPSPSTTTAAPGALRSRLSSSVPFTKSIGARLSQY